MFCFSGKFYLELPREDEADSANIEINVNIIDKIL